MRLQFSSFDWVIHKSALLMVVIVFIISLTFVASDFIIRFTDNLMALDRLVEIANHQQEGIDIVCQYLDMQDATYAHSGGVVLGFRSTQGERGVGIRAFCAVLQGKPVESIDLDSGCEAAAWIHQYAEGSLPSSSVILADAAFELCPKLGVSKWLSDKMLAAYKDSSSADILETFSLRLTELPVGGIVAYATFIQDNLAADNAELALQLSERAVLIYPDHARLRYLHGLALAKQGQTERAIFELCLASYLRQDEAALAYARAAEKLAGREIDCELLLSTQE